MAEVLPSSRFGMKQAKVVERLGDIANPRSISLIAIHSQDLPTVFSEAALEEAERAEKPTLEGRTDLRDIPLVTIDGADARDFDDAVWAEADPDVEGGWHIVVAIADVAFYVRPGRPLDRTPSGAATRPISPTASCRCCRKRCPTISARSASGEDRAAWRSTCGSMRRAI